MNLWCNCYVTVTQRFWSYPLVLRTSATKSCFTFVQKILECGTGKTFGCKQWWIQAFSDGFNLLFGQLCHKLPLFPPPDSFQIANMSQIRNGLFLSRIVVCPELSIPFTQSNRSVLFVSVNVFDISTWRSTNRTLLQDRVVNLESQVSSTLITYQMQIDKTRCSYTWNSDHQLPAIRRISTFKKN